tara:strand:+ start:1652 stop:2545 length:894 start_codon:yes stop_codon:yes gene_type:complete
MLDFLFGSKQAQQTSTSQVQLPDYMEKAASSLVATAGDVAKENFIPYTGPRLAGFSNLEKDAMAQAQASRGVGGLRGAQAFTATTAAGMPAVADIPTYMNPYMTNVADIAARELTRRSDMQRVANQAQATQARAFGGSRADIVEAERQRNLQQGLGDIYAQAQARAFDTALKAAQTDRKTQLASGLGMAQTASAADALNAADINRQLGIGGLQRGMDQAVLDLGYNQFVQERDYPKQQLGFYSDILRGVPTGSMTTTTGPAPQQPSLFGQIAGAGIGALGAAGNLGLTWGDITGFFS